MELRQQEACGTLREALAEAERRSRAALAASQERERELQRTQAETCAAKLATGPSFRFTPSVHALIFVFVCVVAVPHECHRKALACHTSATMPRATSLLPRRNSTCRLCLVPAGELKMQLDEACCDCATQRKRAALQQLQWNRDRGNMCVARSKCMFVVCNPRREWTRGHVLSFFVMRCHKRQGTSRGET